MQTSTYHYYHLKISAKRLPGRNIRCDPLAVVFVGGPGAWREVARTAKVLNDWNPNFPDSIQIPADSDVQRREQIRVDFYNKQVSDDRFLGSVELSFYALIAAQQKGVELELRTPDPVGGHPRVFLTALEGYQNMGSDPAQVALSFQLMQTNYYGVAMKVYYEISRAGAGAWHPVFKSPHIGLDEQGWGQFPETKMSLRDLTMDEEHTGIMISLYRFRRLGSKRLLGHFQTSVSELSRRSQGELIPFTPNTKEDIITADVQVLHAQKTGVVYTFSLKLVNVQWKATYLTEEHVH